MSQGFNKTEWAALTDKQRLELRKVYTGVHRKALEQMTLLREAAKKLQELDDHAMEQTQAILGGANQVMQVFGVVNPLGVEVDTKLDTYEHKDGNIMSVETISAEDLLEATEQRLWFLEQFRGNKTFELPHEDQEDGFVFSWQ